ncbi:MAG: enoyl-CoA hydratase/isomerase family protein, partial [Planctomycetes bacterium]|nr:enoyl-CoA hydratase/isomerase family protein [Planctomycetota bacterium]
MSAFHLTVDQNGIAKLIFDLPGEKVNKFSATVVTELNALLDDLAKRAGVSALVVSSAKKDVFIAGADIKELATISTADEAYAKARAGQMLFQRVADLPFPSVAAIDGACLGGGCEFAMACTYRVVTDNPKTSIGLPEVTLGILPGWGGTVRLPRLVGLTKAIEMILAGRPLNGPRAYKAGLADRCVAAAFLADEVAMFLAQVLAPGGAEKIAARRAQRPFATKLADSGLMRPIVASKARKELMRKTRGLMPSPLKALETVLANQGRALPAALDAEAKAFAVLAMTPECHCLIDCFFASEALKKEGGKAPDKPIQRAGVLGAGVMGGGIAWLFAQNGMTVRLKDISWDAVAKGYKTVEEYSQALVKLRKLTHGEARQRVLRVGGTLDWTGFPSTDVVVEAVVENIEVKKKVLAECERNISDDCVLATNTSSLSVTEMGGALTRPQRLVGMHFFNPVNRMPLVEVVAGARTSPEAVALTAALARRMGKIAVVVKDCPGFLVNRILLPYMNEAAKILQEGGDLATIDKTIYAYGMPMGPFTLTDEVGIDVGHKVAKVLAHAYG